MAMVDKPVVAPTNRCDIYFAEGKEVGFAQTSGADMADKTRCSTWNIGHIYSVVMGACRRHLCEFEPSPPDCPEVAGAF